MKVLSTLDRLTVIRI